MRVRERFWIGDEFLEGIEVRERWEGGRFKGRGYALREKRKRTEKKENDHGGCLPGC